MANYKNFESHEDMMTKNKEVYDSIVKAGRKLGFGGIQIFPGYVQLAKFGGLETDEANVYVPDMWFSDRDGNVYTATVEMLGTGRVQEVIIKQTKRTIKNKLVENYVTMKDFVKESVILSKDFIMDNISVIDYEE